MQSTEQCSIYIMNDEISELQKTCAIYVIEPHCSINQLFMHLGKLHQVLFNIIKL